jgi:hypothetical protein
MSFAVNIFERLSQHSRYGRIVCQLYSLPKLLATSITAKSTPKLFIIIIVAGFIFFNKLIVEGSSWVITGVAWVMAVGLESGFKVVVAVLLLFSFLIVA